MSIQLETAEVRDELRATIDARVAKRRSHYLNDLKLGPAEAAIRLFEWLMVSVFNDTRDGVSPIARCLALGVSRRAEWAFMQIVVRGVV